MASFASNPNLPVSPYISKVDVNAYTQAGMYKQAQYDEGVRKVQGAIDTVAGLEIYRPIDKQYLQGKFNEINTTIQDMAGADFSNQATINQVSGLAGTIYKDQNIQRAVASTQRYKKGLQDMEVARKEGKSSPDNEWFFSKQVEDWTNSNDINKDFSARYVPHVDVMGEFMKAFKEVHADTRLTQEAFTMTPDGKIQINPNGSAIREAEVEGITPQKVQNVSNLVFNRPEIKNQLYISGEYNYKDYTPDNLMTQLKDNYNIAAEDLNSQIRDMQLLMTTDKTQNKTDLTNKIQQLKDTGSQLLEDYKKYSNLPPEQIKAALYQNNLKANLIPFGL